MGPLPEFSIETDCDPPLPTGTFPKFMLRGLMLSVIVCGAGTPVPVSGIELGEIFPLDESESVPDATPAAEGAKLIVTLTDCQRDRVKGRAGPM